MEQVVVGSKPASLGKLIGKGGEGQVFALNGHSGAAVKIYQSRLRFEREQKVRAIVDGGFAARTDLVAYPREIVSDRRGNFLGFLMQLVSGYQPIHELYSPKSRQRRFPQVDYRFLIRAALNIARAVGKVHQTGCVIGDLNHSGILVSPDARVALIDADSFQFRFGRTTYPCVVGVPDFMPPELHGVKLATVVRSVEHDNFGLAVAIFHLLFMGRHPYAGQHEGPDVSIGDAIAQHRFAYSLARRSLTRVRPPPGALTLDQFPDPVRQLFESAFGVKPSVRPSAPTWIKALTRLESALVRCSGVKTHFYPNNASTCLWCHLSSSSIGFDMFPDASAVTSDTYDDTLATEQAIREILSFEFPLVADLILKSMLSTRKSSSELQKARRSKNKRALTGVLTVAGAGAGMYFESPYWFLWLGLAGWGSVLLWNRKIDAKPFQDAFLNAHAGLQRELAAFVARNGLKEVARLRGDLDPAIPYYRSIESNLSEELVKLTHTRESRQRTAFLDQFAIRNAKISGIGPVRKATLVSFGIETAADVSHSAIMQVPGIGAVMAEILLEWRSGLESRFRYKSARNAQDITDEHRVRTTFAKRKAKLGASIRNGLKTLRDAKPRIAALPDRARRDQALLGVLDTRLRAERDLKLLGAPVPHSDLNTLEVIHPQPRPQQPKPPHTSRPAQSRSVSSHTNPKCPQCGSKMRRRSGRYGIFWGCTRYPACKGTRTI